MRSNQLILMAIILVNRLLVEIPNAENAAK